MSRFAASGVRQSRFDCTARRLPDVTKAHRDVTETSHATLALHRSQTATQSHTAPYRALARAAMALRRAKTSQSAIQRHTAPYSAPLRASGSAWRDACRIRAACALRCNVAQRLTLCRVAKATQTETQTQSASRRSGRLFCALCATCSAPWQRECCQFAVSF